MDELADLSALPAQRHELDQRELDLIDRARHAGATWGEIAVALGLASRQAAEQRRQRLRSAIRSRREELDPRGIASLRAAAVDLLRHIEADRSWSGRFTRAPLVRSTLEAAVDAAPGGLFALTEQALSDLRTARATGVPRPLRAAAATLRQALKAAAPSTKH